MNKSLLITTIILISSFFAYAIFSSIAAPSASDKSNPPVWQALGDAYVGHNNNLLIRHSHSDDKSAEYYARALLDLSNREFKTLNKDGMKCYNYNPQTDQDAAAIFQCLFAVTNGENIANHPREQYIWLAKTKNFYTHFSGMIDKEMKSNNPHGINDLKIPKLDVLYKLPSQVIDINKNWHNISLKNGVAKAEVEGERIKIHIDTGSNGIFLSRKVINRLKKKNKITPLNFVDRINGGVNVKSVKSYLVSSFTLGPINITNAYVEESNHPYSLFGITYLRPLNKFTLNDKTVRHMRRTPLSFCSTMKFSHLPIVYSASFPYLNIPTSMGRLGLILDSGLTGSGPFINTTVMIKRGFGVKLFNAGKIANASTVIGSFTGISGRRRFQTIVFGLKVHGVSTKGYVGLSSGVGSRVAGSMTKNFLKLFSVSYDYINRTMCITPQEKNDALSLLSS